MILHNEKLIFILKIAETLQIPATKKKKKVPEILSRKHIHRDISELLVFPYSIYKTNYLSMNL